MNPKYICSICGQSTYDVDMDYLIGVDHLSCVLEISLKMNKIVIENWGKLNGQTFHTLGCELIIQDCCIREKCYEAWIYQTRVTPSEALMRVDLWFDYEIGLKVFPPAQFTNPPISLYRNITKEHVKNPSIFLATICEMMAGNKEVRNILTFYR